MASHRDVEGDDVRLRLMAGLGHDLRAPLATIAGHASLLRDVLPASHAPYLHAIERSVAHQLALIDDLLEYSAGELQPLELRRAAVRFGDFIDDVAQSAFALGQKNGNVFEVVCSHALPASVLLDERRLRRVLLNLLANAAEHTVGGRVELEVQSQREGPAWRVTFRVADTGGGMSAAQQQRLFECPVQGEPLAGLHGWGLPIARRIVECMGGHLDIVSTPVQGTVLSFVLMLEAAAQEDDGAEPARPALPDAARAALARLAGQGQWSDIGELLDRLIVENPADASATLPVRAALDALDFQAIRALAGPA